jgi:O-antigen ligase
MALSNWDGIVNTATCAFPTTMLEARPQPRPLWLPVATAWALMLLTFSIGEDVPGSESLDAIVSKIKYGVRGIAILVLACAIFSHGIGRHGRTAAFHTLRSLLPFGLFVGWAILSTYWSALKTISLAQAGSLLALYLLSMNVALSCKSDDDTWTLLRHLCTAMFAISCGLLLLSVAAPQLEVMGRSGTGLFHATNTAGTASLGLLLLMASRLIWRWRWTSRLLIPAIPVHVAVLYLSANRLAVGLLIVMCALFVVFYTRRSLALVAVLLISVVGTGYLAVDPGLELVRKLSNSTSSYAQRGQSAQELLAFSGRDEMWQAMWASHGDARWIGHGYFVTSATGSLEVWYDEGNYTAHNLLLQVLVTTGLIGCALFLWGILRPLLSSLCRLALRVDTRRLAAFVAIVAAWFAGWGLLNESFMGPVQPESVVFFCVLGMAVGRCKT